MKDIETCPNGLVLIKEVAGNRVACTTCDNQFNLNKCKLFHTT